MNDQQHIKKIDDKRVRENLKEEYMRRGLWRPWRDRRKPERVGEEAYRLGHLGHKETRIVASGRVLVPHSLRFLSLRLSPILVLLCFRPFLFTSEEKKAQ